MKTWTLKDVADHWDASPDYDAINANIDSYTRRFRDSAPLFTIPNGGKVLDIDCRTGNGTVFFAQKYPTATFTCVAMAPSFVERAKQNLGFNKVAADVSLLTGMSLPFQNGIFDVILTYETLEHVPWPGRYVAELSRITKPGGTLVLTTPNVLWEPVHWFSAKLHLDHGEGPHRMVPRREILDMLRDAGWNVMLERSFVIVPAGPNFLLTCGRFLERMLPEHAKRVICLRRSFICRKIIP